MFREKTLFDVTVERLGRLFGAAGAPIPSLAPVVAKAISSYEIKPQEHESVLHGMDNLKDLKTVIAAMITIGSDKGDPVFQLEGSDHKILLQDIVLKAPDQSLFVMRLHVRAEKDENEIQKDFVTDVETFVGQEPAHFYDVELDSKAEQKIIHRVMAWIADKCPNENMADFDRLLPEYIHLIDDVDIGLGMLMHIPNTFSDVSRPLSKDREPS